MQWFWKILKKDKFCDNLMIHSQMEIMNILSETKRKGETDSFI